MATIDKLDLSVYNLYAIRTMMVEQTNQKMHLDQAASIPPQTMVVNSSIKLTELDLLLGIVPLHTPWAYFYPPAKFALIRRSPFSFSRVAPSFGSLSDQDNEEELLESISCSTDQEESEKSAIRNCFKQIGQINRWMGYIVGRIGQFLQG